LNSNRCPKRRYVADGAAAGLAPENWIRSEKVKEKVARFRQINMDKPHVHHDALEFPNGEVVLLTRLMVGQTATALQLPVSPYDKARV
jgi:hypothetical protein